MASLGRCMRGDFGCRVAGLSLKAWHPARRRKGSLFTHLKSRADASSSGTVPLSEEAQRKREERMLQRRLLCPGCDGKIRENKILEHMRNCCHDLMPDGKWPGPEIAISEAARKQAALREEVLALRFEYELMEDEIGRYLGVPTSRIRTLLRKESRAQPIAAEEAEVDVVYEDEDVLVVNKPPFMRHHPSHRFQGGSLLNVCKGYLGFEPYVVHRLDMDTSGVAVFAKHARAARSLSKQFRAKRVQKAYVALGLGESACSGTFVVDDPIADDPSSYTKRMISPEGKDALTEFEVITSWDPSLRERVNLPVSAALLRVKPITGRTHQIRVHAKQAGIPLLGDPQYPPDERHFGTLSRALHNRLQRQALHAASLRLYDPSTNEEVVYSAPLPRDMVRIAVDLGCSEATARGASAVA